MAYWGQHARRAAFTLVEVLMSVGVIGVTFFALYAGITYGFTVLVIARENLRATQILMEKMETIRLYNWDQINSNGFIPTEFVVPFSATNMGTNFGTSSGVLYYGTMTITDAPVTEVYGVDMRFVTVTVHWESNRQPRTRTMSTLVSRYGLQNYIY
jgi:type II secretory pathway pseudopilin PulG